VYDPSDVDCELRWCGPCHRWFHSSCVEVENTLELGEDDDQLYLLEKGTDLFSRLISRPVRRYSRKHGAPLSLEKIQTHLISKWRLLKGGVYDAERLSHDVEECDLFAGGVKEDKWEQAIESALKVMGDWEWMKCPSCLSSYI
jgi:hypothetical protein